MAGDTVDQLREDAGAGLVLRAAGPVPASDLLDYSYLSRFLEERAESSGNRAEFLTEFAADLGSFLRATAVVIQAEEEGGVSVLGLYLNPARKAEPGNWIPSAAEVDQVLKSGEARQAEVLISGRHLSRFMIPFQVRGEASLCLSGFLDPGPSGPDRISLVIASLASLAIARRDAAARLGEKEVFFHQATLLVEMVSRTAGSESFKQSLQVLALELESFFGCQLVAIGTGSARICHVDAVSGVNQGDRRSLGHSQLASAMREAIALGEMTVWPVMAELPREVAIAANHDDLLHSYKAGRVLVVPLVMEEMGFRGAIALLWPRDTPEIPPRTHRLLVACQAPLAGLVALLDQSKPRAFRARLLQFWRGGVGKRVAAIAAVLLLVGGLLLPITYRLPADCRVEPLLRRTIAAPFESRLEKSHVKPGDRVEKDQILAELDGREIRVALAEAIAARSAALKKRDNAMVLSDPSGLQMAQLEADRLDLEVERLQYRNDNLIIRSPLAGVVLAGDLERSEGVPVTAGQKLFEVAPLAGMVLEVSVPDREVRHVETGMKVEYRLESDSGRKRIAQLSNLHPAAEISEGDHVFIAEAALENPDGFLRPGMKGEARILSGKKPVAWIFFHGLWEYLRLKLW